MKTKRLSVVTLLLGTLFCPAGVVAGQASSVENATPLQDLGNSKLAELGFVDVTAAPFTANPTGQRDVTAPLQRAINFARDHQMVCFFPPGVYRVSKTLRCEQYRPMRSPARRKGTRDYPCVLVGSRRADRRPRIVLAAHSSGFGDPEHPKYVVHFFAMGIGTEMPLDQLQPNISMNQMLIGIDPRRWHMLLEHPPAGETIATQPLERPVLYLRGAPSE